MPPDDAFLGIDLGTSSLKLALCAPDGLLAESEAAYAVATPEPGWAEIDPGLWVRAIAEAVERLLEHEAAREADLAAVSFSGQMHGVVLGDESGAPVRPAVLWPDQRAAEELPAWRALPGADLSRLANPLVAGMAGPILGWLARHESETLRRTARVMSPKDWLRRQLAGDDHTERSDASATLLWDVVDDAWSAAAVRAAGLVAGQLPAVVASDTVVGEIGWRGLGSTRAGRSSSSVGQQRAAVVVGGADTACALDALAATQTRDAWAGSVVVNVGTGVQLARPVDRARPRTDPVTHLYADTRASFYEMLALQNGGLALSWVQRELGLDWAGLLGAAQQSPPGANGVSFMPFVTGERGGVAPPTARAGWEGATTAASQADLARAAFEGVAFAVRRGLELLGHHTGSTGTILLTGGGVRDPWVRQLFADALDRSLTQVSLRSASAVGAALLAARGCGTTFDLHAATTVIEPTTALPAVAYERWLSAVTIRAGLDA